MAKTTDATLITNANKGLSLDVAERQRRYLITMGVRTGCFLAFLVVPGWWKVAALVAAALLPAIAVLLANNTDHHAPGTVGSDDGQARLAIGGGEVVAGSVEETDAADGESR